MKEKVINDILLKMQEELNRQQLRALENVMVQVLYSVELVAMETQLATGTDTNRYMLETALYNMRKRDLSERTIEQYIRTAKNFEDITHKNYQDVTPVDVEYYLGEFAKGKKRKNGNKSINNELSFLSAFFTWLRRCNFITRNPAENVQKRKEIKKPIDFLRGIDIEMLRDACEVDTLRGYRERAVLEFLLSTGCRVGEVPQIRISDIDFQNGEIVIYGNKDREYRTVYLGDAAKLHIKKYISARTDNSEYLFVTMRKPHTAIGVSRFRDILQDIRERAEMQRRIYPHLMRKTMASIMRQHGAGTDDIADLLGHADTDVTKKYYAARDEEHLRATHRRCTA